MITQIYDVSIPSDVISLLSSLIGRKLVNMVRFNSEPVERLINEFEIEVKDLFSLCDGGILLYFEDGLVIGFGENPRKNSLVIWVEKNEIGQSADWLLEEWDEALPFYAKDFDQLKIFLGKTIISISIIKEIDINDENPKIDNLPSERGVLLQFTGELSFIISYGLNSKSHNVEIISPEQIHVYFNDRLVYKNVNHDTDNIL